MKLFALKFLWFAIATLSLVLALVHFIIQPKGTTGNIIQGCSILLISLSTLFLLLIIRRQVILPNSIQIIIVFSLALSVLFYLASLYI